MIRSYCKTMSPIWVAVFGCVAFGFAPLASSMLSPKTAIALAPSGATCQQLVSIKPGMRRADLDKIAGETSVTLLDNEKTWHSVQVGLGDSLNGVKVKEGYQGPIARVQFQGVGEHKGQIISVLIYGCPGQWGALM